MLGVLLRLGLAADHLMHSYLHFLLFRGQNSTDRLQRHYEASQDMQRNFFPNPSHPRQACFND